MKVALVLGVGAVACLGAFPIAGAARVKSVRFKFVRLIPMVHLQRFVLHAWVAQGELRA